MHEALRPMLMGVVLLNLVFVQITGAVSLTWILPLYALTLAGPALARFHDHLTYRSLWNLSVIALFAVLAHHATSNGINKLLEDGLILAALCQVHLYNNLGSSQKPDLLFFNSFLIAFVTSFFCQELIYCAVFVAHVLWVIPSLQIYIASDSTVDLDRKTLNRMVRDSIPKSGLALGLTALVFFFCPRDFHREGWINENVYFARPPELTVGFSEEVRLGRYGRTTFSEQEVLRIRTEGRPASAVPNYWRGATFLNYGSNGWFAERQVQTSSLPGFDSPWVKVNAETWARADRDASAQLRVMLLDPSAKRLFLPLETGSFRLPAPADPEYAGILTDGTVVYSGRTPLAPDSQPLVYDVSISRPAPQRLGLSASQMRQLTSLNEHVIPPIARELARSLRDRLPGNHTDRDLVETYRHHLSQSYEYLAPGDAGGASGLEDFLGGRVGGHCEYFATALAVMLRTQDIPCRLVTGFLATEWDENRQTLIARQTDAHAWVEVLDPETGWYVVDPSPSGGLRPDTGSDGLWGRIRTGLEDVWAAVTGFDSEGYRRVFAWLRQSPQKLVGWIAGNPRTSTLLIFLGIMAGLGRRWWRRRHVSRHVLAYRSSVKRARLEPLPGETPRELLERARQSNRSARALEALTLATRSHEEARYARG